MPEDIANHIDGIGNVDVEEPSTSPQGMSPRFMSQGGEAISLHVYEFRILMREHLGQCGHWLQPTGLLADKMRYQTERLDGSCQ